MTKKMRVVPKTDDASVAPGLLLHLSDMKGFMVADPNPDIRGWRVTLPDGRRVGKVDDLLIDTTQLEVRYLEVKVDHDVIGADEDTWVLVPAGAARIHEKDDSVVIDRLPVAGLAGAPRSSARTTPSAEQERVIRDYFAPATRTAGAEDDGLFDSERLCRPRRSEKARAPDRARKRV